MTDHDPDSLRAHHLVNLMRSVSRASPAAVRDKKDAGARDVLYEAITNSALLRGENVHLFGKKGRPLKWLIDIRRIFLDAECLTAFAEIFCDSVADRGAFQLGGLEISSIPFLAAAALTMSARGKPVNGFVIRKERKLHGTGNLIEGVVNDLPIVLIDDILNSGRSLESARVAISTLNRTIDTAFVIIDYHTLQSRAWRTAHDVQVRSIFDLREFGLVVRERRRNKPRSLFQNIWHFAAPNPSGFHRVPKSFPTTNGEKIYFGSDCGQFWCIDAATGIPTWTFSVNSKGSKNIWSAPVLEGGKVYFGSYDGNVYCLDAGTGVELWRHIGADWVGSSPAIASDLGLLYIGFEFAIKGKQGSIVALDIATGEKIWEHRTKRYTHASPAYCAKRKLVACGSNDDEMLLFDAATGELQWRFTTRGSVRHAPAFDSERAQLITGCAAGYIYLIDLGSGKEVYSIKTNNSIYTIPLVLHNVAYVGSTDKHLYIVDLENKAVIQRLYVGSAIFGPPREFNGKVYFGACNGIVYEIDPIALQVSGMHQLPDAVTNALTYRETTGYLYALTYMNELFAFRRLASAKTSVGSSCP